MSPEESVLGVSELPDPGPSRRFVPKIHSAIRIGDPHRQQGKVTMCGCENDSCRCNPQCSCVGYCDMHCAFFRPCEEKSILCPKYGW